MTVQTANLVGVPVVSSGVSTPPTTLQISTVGVDLNSSLTTQTNGGVLSTTASSPTGVVGSSVYGSPLSYASPTPWGTYGSPSSYGEGESGYSSQPPSYNQLSTYNDGGDDDSGYGASPSDGREESSSEDGSGSGSYGDGGDDEGDVETGPWALGSAPYSEGGSESGEQSGGGSFLDWLLEILK